MHSSSVTGPLESTAPGDEIEQTGAWQFEYDTYTSEQSASESGLSCGTNPLLDIALSEHFREGKTIVSAELAEASVVWIHALERTKLHH